MNLHRADRVGQWESIPENKHNHWQKIAAKTDGKITPANAVSVAGGSLVLAGLHDIYKGKTRKGLVKVGIGRMADLADGTVAEKTGTKSPVGEAVDAGVDKALMAATVPVLMKREVLPPIAAGAIFAQNAASASVSVLAKRSGESLHPSKEGKLATFGQWTAIGLYSMASAARQMEANKKIERSLEVAGHLTLAAATFLGTKAVIGYAQEALSSEMAFVLPENQAATSVPQVPSEIISK